MASNDPFYLQGYPLQPASGSYDRLHTENQRLKRRLASKEQEIRRLRERCRALESGMAAWMSDAYQYNMATEQSNYTAPLGTEQSNIVLLGMDPTQGQGIYYYMTQPGQGQGIYYYMTQPGQRQGIYYYMTQPGQGQGIYYYMTQPGQGQHPIYFYYVERGWKQTFIDVAYIFGQALADLVYISGQMLTGLTRFIGQASRGFPHFFGQTLRWALRVCLLVGIPVGLVLLYNNISPDIRYAMHVKLQLYISMAMNKIRLAIAWINSALEENTTV